MYSLDEILRMSVEEKASDIHFTAGCPPYYRIDGVLTPLKGDKLLPTDLETLLLPILDNRHRNELETNGQTDLAYAIPGVGRFRVNVYKQRGTLASAMRCLPFSIPDADSLGIPAEVQALRAALREDPDVILVGEMRDLETISTALTAAETGHLVLSTLHTIGADKTIDRIIDVFPPNQQQQVRIQLASVLECIISQQLIRREDGRGRVAALEVLFANTAIRNMIRENKTYQIISTMQTGKRQGMQTMDDAIYELFLRGDISADSAVSYAQKPGEMSGKVNFDMP